MSDNLPTPRNLPPAPSAKLSYFEQARQLEGIPDAWKGDDCLVLRVHRGVFRADIPEHLASFRAMLTDPKSVTALVPAGDYERAVFNVTQGGIENALLKLRTFVNIAVSDAQTNPQAVGKTINFIFHPALDRKGNSVNGPLESIPIHADDCAGQLARIRNFFERKGLATASPRPAVPGASLPDRKPG